MSTFYFRTLILGADPNTIHFYISRAFGEAGEDHETYFKWYKETKVLDDICDLEIDAITSISADLDEIIPMVDGIIYFLNPTIQEESELFEMILPDIFSVKRDIPTIIIFYDQNGILPLSINDLLTHIWVNFPSLEAFANLPPKDFHQALQSLCLAMINGDTPLNIENAWMRFPIFIQMANIYFNNKNYYYAAQAIRKTALIADIYNKEEFFIISEQAAYLYSKINLYLEASKILEKVDRKKSINFKKLYADAIIREGNLFFNKNEYERAARNYERVAQWSSIELLERTFIHEAFRLAINSWISACRVEDAFRILQSLHHKGVIVLLKEFSDKIGAAADYLVSINSFELAKEQLYRAVNRYQREDLFEELKDLTSKLVDVLIILFKQQINDQKNHAAKNTFDEIENLWDSYKVKKINLDSTLEELINHFLEANNFRMATILIDKLNSRKLKQQISKIRDELEDKYNALKKKEVEDYINKGIDILRDFFVAEIDIIAEINTQEINKANELAKQNKYLKAAKLLKNQADYLKRIGKEDIKDQILTKSLDILLNGLEFENFFLFFNELSFDMKTKYLTRIFPKYFQNLQELRKSEDFKRNEKIFESSNRIYRNQMLYDQSKEITLIFIKVIKQEALRILEIEENLSGISKATILEKNALNIKSAYLDKEENIKIKYNKIYKKIAEIYIELDDLHLAHIYNDKIEKAGYKIEIHKKIEKLEAEKSKKRSEKAKETRDGEVLREQRSIMENKAREAKLDRKNELRERKGLRRAYFENGLIHLKNQEFDQALKLYKETTNRLNRIKKYNIAGVSLAVASLILMKEEKFKEIKQLLLETKKPLSGMAKLFSETFAVTLLEYIIGLKNIQDDLNFRLALPFFEVLPLFEEELILLYEIKGEEYQKEEKPEKTLEMYAKQRDVERHIKKLAESIEKELHHVKKREAIQNQYWRLILDDISKGKMTNASISYLETVPKLIKEGYTRLAAVSLILGSIILLNEKDLKIAKETFEKHVEENKSDLESLPEIQIMEYFFPAVRKDEKSVVKLIINSLVEKLVLFEPEIKSLKIILGEEVSEEEEIREMLSREEYGKLSKLRVEYDQIYGKLQAKVVDAKRDKERILKRRTPMKRRYYLPILELLEIKNFKNAGEKYLELAFTLTRRNDLETSSLMMLLHGLTFLKSGEPLKSIKNNLNNYLNSLGVNKKLVEETFYIMLILFLIEVKIYNFDKYLHKIKEMLEILPLFEEERVLIEIEE